MHNKITMQAQELLEGAVFPGGGRFLVYPEKNAVEFDDPNEDVSPSDVGRALAFIVANRDCLDMATTFSVAGWYIDGLDESNFGLISVHTWACENYSCFEVGIVESGRELDDSAIRIEGDRLYIKSGDSFRAWVDGSYISDFVSDGKLDFDEFIRFDRGLSEDERRSIFEVLGEALEECVVSAEFGKTKTFVDIALDLFDAMRVGKDQVYAMVEQEFGKHGIDIDVRDMKAEAVRVLHDGKAVYRFTPTSFTLNNRHEESVFASADAGDDQDCGPSVRP